MLRPIIKHLSRKKYTVSEHLTKNGFLTETELYVELAYCRRVLPVWIRRCYCVGIVPVVLLLKAFPKLNPLAARIARAVWIDKAIEEELNYVKNNNKKDSCKNN